MFVIIQHIQLRQFIASICFSHYQSPGCHCRAAICHYSSILPMRHAGPGACHCLFAPVSIIINFPPRRYFASPASACLGPDPLRRSPVRSTAIAFAFRFGRDSRAGWGASGLDPGTAWLRQHHLSRHNPASGTGQAFSSAFPLWRSGRACLSGTFSLPAQQSGDHVRSGIRPGRLAPPGHRRLPLRVTGLRRVPGIPPGRPALAG